MFPWRTLSRLIASLIATAHTWTAKQTFGQIKVTTGAGANKVLKSDANGDLTYATVPSLETDPTFDHTGAVEGSVYRRNAAGKLVPITGVTADESGAVVMTNTLSANGPGRDITTGSDTLDATADNNGLFGNAEATADITYVLPTPAVGVVNKQFSFLVTHIGHEFYVDNPGQFRGLYSTNANGDRLAGDKVEGSILNVKCRKADDGAYYWFTTGMGGWTDAD